MAHRSVVTSMTKMPFVLAMNKTPLTVNLGEWVKQTCALPQNQDKAEVRTLATLVTAGFLGSLIEPLVYLFFVPASLISRVAGMAPSEFLVASAFSVALVCTVPHLLALLFVPKKLAVEWPRKLATFGAFLAAVAWLYLVALAMPMDVGLVEWAYGARVACSLLVGGAYGVSLNAQHLRQQLAHHAQEP